MIKKIKSKQVNFLKNKPRLARVSFFLYRNFFKKSDFKYFDHGNIAIHKYRAIYFPIPKVASSSMKKYIAKLLDIQGLKKYEGQYPRYYNFRDFPYIKKTKLKKYKDYFKFTFVRNPWERIFSCYKHWIGDYDINNNFKIYKDFFPGMTFKEFVYAIKNIPDHVADGHFRSQHTFITDKKGNLMVDFIGKTENFDQSFKKICKITGMPYKKLSKVNVKANSEYRSHYTEETKEIIRQRYKKDIEMFDYEF